MIDAYWSRNMADLLKRLESISRNKLADAMLALPKPRGCGCQRRAERAASQLRSGEDLVKIVKDMLNDFRGKY
jgi:hypothetical protein